jgi:hypothetical protein
MGTEAVPTRSLSEDARSRRMVRVRRVAMHRLLHSAVLVLAVVGAPRAARARTAVVATRLEYVAAPGCPSVTRFEAVVIGRLGYDPFRADAPDRVSVRIESSGKALEGRLEWRDPSEAVIGEQSFPSRTGDCDELTRAMGFALALQVQLMAATAEETRAPPTRATTPATLAPTPSVVPASPSPTTQIETVEPRTSGPDDSPHGPSVLIGAGASAGFGLASDPVALGRVFASVAWPHVAVELAGEAIAPSTTHRADGAGFSQEEFLASVAGCGVQSVWSLCAVGKIGELRIAGQNVDVPLSASGLMIQAGLRLTASHTFGHRTYIIARAEGLGRVTQGTVTLDSMPVWTTPRFAALLGIDVGVRFR